MRKCGKGTLLLMSAVMATSLFRGVGRVRVVKAQKNEVYANDQKKRSVSICSTDLVPWLSYRQKIIGCFRMKE